VFHPHSKSEGRAKRPPRIPIYTFVRALYFGRFGLFSKRTMLADGANPDLQSGWPLRPGGGKFHSFSLIPWPGSEFAGPTHLSAFIRDFLGISDLAIRNISVIVRRFFCRSIHFAFTRQPRLIEFFCDGMGHIDPCCCMGSAELFFLYPPLGGQRRGALWTF